MKWPHDLPNPAEMHRVRSHRRESHVQVVAAAEPEELLEGHLVQELRAGRAVEACDVE
jgi:hypothetical protein